MKKRKKGYFSISAVAQMFSVHQQTIRLYEKEGLIAPKRSDGNTRLFSEDDINRLEEIIYLTHQLGINLAGVEMILKLQKQIQKLQKEINKAFDITNEELTSNIILTKKRAEESAKKLITIKKPVTQQKNTNLIGTFDEGEQPADDPWQIDYEE
jgi:MerR family transcriptional regulator, heat shock protein HspR